jgi:hypothetical protein
MDSQWQFVASTGDGKSTDAKTRKIVRANAMRAFRRNERLQRMKSTQLAHIRNEDGSSHSSGSSSLGKPSFETLEAHRRAPSPLGERMGTGIELDPFLTTMLHTQQEADRLFTHCRYNFISPLLSILFYLSQ